MPGTIPTLGWLTGGQWGGIYGSPMECLGIGIRFRTEAQIRFSVFDAETCKCQPVGSSRVRRPEVW